MPKPAAKANPKLGLMRGVFNRLRPVLLRGVGELARMQVNANPAVIEAEATKLVQQLEGLMKAELARTGLPVLAWDAPLPAPTETGGEAWMYAPLTGWRNALHGLGTCGPVLVHVANGVVDAGGFLCAERDEPLLAAVGEGTSCGGRVRVSGRPTLTDALVQLPMTSGDAARLKLMELADRESFHTRKTGCPLVEALLVAQGQSDALVATRLTPAEAGLMTLAVKEAGGVVQTLGADGLVAGGGKVAGALGAILA